MPQDLTAHFDGKVIVPDKPLQLPPGQRLRVQIETIEADEYPLTQIGNLATDMGVSDLADGHRQYARPTPPAPSDG
jgi:hypothetical protein